MKRALLRGEISYSSAKDKEVNILQRLEYPEKQNQFITDLINREQWIKGVVAHHLNITPSKCHVADPHRWLWGSFNLCIPITIHDWIREQPGNQVLLRLPLPYKVGEAFRPGNIDEKIRCEASTYAWLEENHPHIPIPRLYGFSLSSGESFTTRENLPFFSKYYQYIRRQLYFWASKFIWSISALPSAYIRHQYPALTPPSDLAYLLIEYIEPKQGTMLSNTWKTHSNNTAMRTTLFRSLARILLSFARVPLPCIGSFTIDNNGFISLSNRPLTLEIQELENERIPIDIPRDYTYQTSDSYITDIVGLHDNRLLYQPNAINDGSDYIQQIATLSGIRLSIPFFFCRELRRGPFIFSLTDLHQSNIFVDQHWNITSLVDLEWGCSLPIEMIHPPYWLTSEFADAIDEDEYKTMWAEFVRILAQEEDYAFEKQQHNYNIKNTRLSTIMTKAWEMGTLWYSLALRSPAAIFRLFLDRIQPKLGKGNYSNEQYGLVMAFQWRSDIGNILTQKIKDREAYDIDLRRAFLPSETSDQQHLSS
ncbi:hypothetical protein TESG_05366 [Trichophyton tonsurans CBS 112818]|uniref:Aminoglycoside phosphotransferase domain-containing protein n=1 Tax=Trichophyton tonsurans (strain CBS 112818) TaxID=647933 RepID=F2S2R3_TRIT1|nr:hypothetical protein TESG_05366 [Trichophyton tonsurans CBS 112818]